MIKFIQYAGGFCIALIVVMAMARPQEGRESVERVLTPYEYKQAITYAMCRTMVKDAVKGARLPITHSHARTVDDNGIVWEYADTVEAKNGFGQIVDELFYCRVKFYDDQGFIDRLKIGRKVVYDE